MKRHLIRTSILTAASMTIPAGVLPAAGAALPSGESIAAVKATFASGGEGDAAPKSLGATPVEEYVGDATEPNIETGGLANDECSNGTVIPGNVTTYNPPTYSTVTADAETCDNIESCESGGVGVSNSVWYSYTPDADGTIEINTQGSNYNTVLSVWSGCRFPVGQICAGGGTQLACNDNAPEFGNPTWSRVFLDVTAGTIYRIKVADFNTTSGGGTLDFNLRYFPPNDACENATTIGGVAYNPPLLRTGNAQTEVCDSNESCELSNVGVSNSVWYRYVPPCDGSISVNTNGSSYDTVISIWIDGCDFFVDPDVGCDGGNTQIACDDDSGTSTQSQLLNVPVQKDVEYLIKVADYNPSQGGGSLDFNFLFNGAGEPSADITDPITTECVCRGTVPVIGTASTGADALADWVLDSRPQSGGIWTTIASGNSPVSNALLANWNTSGLNGYYFLRLTVRNACGDSNSDVEFVYVDGAAPACELRSPVDGNVLGGLICFDGTAWDICFLNYSVEYRPTSGGAFTPVQSGVANYTTPVTNDPLTTGGWNTQTPGVPDGDYEVRLTVRDICGQVSTANAEITVDNTPPVAVITSPAECAVVNGVVQVIGTANDANLLGWTLQRSDPATNGWVTISSGNTPVVNGLLGSFNTVGLEGCCYVLRLIVSDQSQLNCSPFVHQTEYLVPIDYAGQGIVGDVNCDGFVTVADIGAFVLAITNPAAYAAANPTCNINLADTNGDNFVTVADIGPFVCLLTGC